MSSSTDRLARRVRILIVALAGFFVASHPASAQDVQHLSITQPGGMPGLPIITGIERGTNCTRVTWDGPSGYYQLFQKKDLTSRTWQPVGGPT